MGTLDPGKSASFLVVEGDIFSAEGRLLETWVAGKRHVVEPQPDQDVRGTWELAAARPDGTPLVVVLELGGSRQQPAGRLRLAEAAIGLIDVQLRDGQLQARFDTAALSSLSGQGWLSLSLAGQAAATASLVGRLVWPDGTHTAATATQTSAEVPQLENATSTANAGPHPQVLPGATQPLARQAVAPPSSGLQQAGGSAGSARPGAADSPPARALFEVNYPLGAFGTAGPPEQPAAVLFTHATVWTGAEQGTLENADVLVERGLITAVGPALAAPEGALMIDLAGKHLTAGVIDCHSHIATDGGVNETGQAITAEVRIGDFIDPDDIAIYRQLAGGVTCANILHGSANPIGGQCQVIKFRWGGGPDELKFAEAPPCIKFALGENVKQSNWGDRFTTRYPQTRMGVQQIIQDAFLAARQYRRQWEAWRARPSGIPPRVDLELEALAEVLEGRRLLHCHSYRQDEILAFLRTCEQFGVRVATLQHVLEGYKLADVIARHGAGASAFSDWWAYKFEVYDAIPYNGALMHRAGVVVTFNSDDAELGRRLHLEAAKAVKYGGVPAAEAWKFVTLNAARQMGIDRWVGSIEPGKHADLVVWSATPMSGDARCEQTWIDGRKYFDLADDARRREQARQMRAQLVQRVLASGELPAPPRAASPWPRTDEYCPHCHHP
ncbi:MAG: amidohydrolase [Pirellulales bacterium]|nr:amidohydrolase [Pirellulales bacterium]